MVSRLICWACFAVADSLPQSTTHLITEAPGKVIIHVGIPTVETDTSPTSSGLNAPYEALVIATIFTDDDGTLKIKQIEGFWDSQAYVERIKSFGLT